MSQAQGTRGYLAIQKETTFATDPAAPDLTKLYFLTESLTRSIDLIANEHLRNDRSPAAPVRGNTNIAGGINLNFGPYPAQMLLGTLGAVTTSGAGPYTHVIKVGTSLPSFTIEKGYSDIAQFIKYNGCKINKFGLVCSPSGFQKASFDILGAKATASGTSFDATITDLGDSCFDGFRISAVTEGGAPITGITEITINMENGLDGDTFTIGGAGIRGSINEGLTRVSGTIKGFFENLTLYNKAINQTESSLKVTYTMGTGLGSAGNESVEINIPELLYAAGDPPIAGPKGIFYSLNFMAYYANDAGASAAIITVKNTQVTI